MSEIERQDGDDAEKGSRSPYSRIRTSFVAKFGNLLSPGKPGNEDGGDTTSRDKSGRLSLRRKSAVPRAPEVDPADTEEIRMLIKEATDSNSRRGALLGLFKLSLRENLLEVLMTEGAVEALIVGINQESKGSGARRAAMQTLRNLAAHIPNQQFLLDAAVPTIASVMMEEASGSVVREAALEALSNLSSNPKIRSKLMATENMTTAILACVKTEPQGTQGRESALSILERMTQPPPPSATPSASRTPEKSARALKRQPPPQAEDKLDEEDEDESFDVQVVIDACLEASSKEAKGSAAKKIAVRTLRNLASGRYRAKVASTPGLYEGMLNAAGQDGPGSETRWLVFALFSELSNDTRNCDQLMKTASLVDTVIAAVRDEPTGSPAREYAMLTVAHLCRDPKYRPAFMKGSADGLVSVCVRASTQEAPASGGRAAALELCAALALAPENQEMLFQAQGLLALAVDSAHNEKSERVKIAGLDLIASLAGASDVNRAAIFKLKHTNEAVVKAACEDQSPELQGAGLAALRALCLSPDIRGQMRKATLEGVLTAARTARSGSRVKNEAVACLEEGHFDKWADARLSYELIEACAYILKHDMAGSDIKVRACSLLTVACKNKLHGVVMQSGVATTLITQVRDFADGENQARSSNGKAELYSRASLRRVPVSKHAVASAEEMAADCNLALRLLAVLARTGQIIEGALGACQSLLKLYESPPEEATNKLEPDAIRLATLTSVLSVNTNCSSAAVAKEYAELLAKPALDMLLPMLNGEAEKGSITSLDVLEVLFILSSYQNCVEAHFATVVNLLAQMVCDKADNSENPRVPYLLCCTLLNCLFVPSLADQLKVSEIRPKLDQTLLRIASRGGEEHAFAAAGRAAQGLTLGFKIIPPQAGNSAPNAKERRVAVLCASDGLLLAKHAEDIVKKVKEVKGLAPRVEEADWFSDKWEKIAIKLRKIHLEQVVQEIKSAHGVVICASKGAEADPVIRMLAEFVRSSGVPTVVCTGVETSSNVCWGSWLDKFKATVGAKDVVELHKWPPICKQS